MLGQNRRQKVFYRGASWFCGRLCVCAGGLDIIKLNKTSLIYSVSRFNLAGLGALFGGAKLTKALRGDGTGLGQPLSKHKMNKVMLEI